MIYDKRMDALLTQYRNKLTDSLESVTTPTTERKVRVNTPYGYEYKSKMVKFKRLDWKGTPIKWGFNDAEAEFNTNNFEEHFVVADRKRMDKIMAHTFKTFDSYIDKEVAKILLEGHSAFFNYRDAIDVTVEVTESCVSPKGNCITHIILKPSITIAVEDG